jgi:hypothetical protein
MNRRQFLRLGGGVATGLALAGCSSDSGPGGDGSTDGGSTATENPGGTAAGSGTESGEDKPSGIYIQSFEERMSMQGMAEKGPYGFALMFTVPHTFWTVTGDSRSRLERAEEDSIHLMVSVWDTQTATVVPETGLSVELTRDGELVSQETIYPMLSQPMSFHYGGNFPLGEDGTYAATITVGGTNTRLTGAFADRLTEPAEVDIPLEFTEESRDEVVSRPLEAGGQPGALKPMETMSMPQSVAPTEEELPGTVRGTATSDDARFVVTTLERADPVGADGAYLVASARTRYNGYTLPAMGVSATLERGAETVYDGRLERTLDPELGYHYGAAVESVESGDDLTLTVETPPQVARHEGYETAFLQFEPMSLTL